MRREASTDHTAVPRRRVKRQAFVVMPFSPTQSCPAAGEWTEVFEHVFTPALRGAGYHAVRLEPSSGNLTRSIIRNLHSSTIVLADVTDRNANVFYELGLRHALARRGTIIVSQDERHVPSDLRGYWFTIYSRTPGAVARFRADLKALLSKIDADPTRPDSPVAEYMAEENHSGSLTLDRINAKQLGALYTELTGNISVLENHTFRAHLHLLEYECLDLLLRTFYVDLGPQVLRDCFEYRNLLKALKNGSPGAATGTQALTASKVLARICFDVRSGILLGEYKEPEQLSTMIWTSPRERAQFTDPLSMASCIPGDMDRRVLLLSCSSTLSGDIGAPPATGDDEKGS